MATKKIKRCDQGLDILTGPPLSLFIQLTEDEKAEFRAWARENYKVGKPINGVWHPVVQAECVAMNKEEL